MFPFCHCTHAVFTRRGEAGRSDSVGAEYRASPPLPAPTCCVARSIRLSPPVGVCLVASFNTTHSSCAHQLEVLRHLRLYRTTPNTVRYLSLLHFVGRPMATPSSGLRRSYNCSTLLPGGKFLLCGTDVGDMVVYGCVVLNV